MTTKTLKLGLVMAIVTASVALPLAVHYRIQEKLRVAERASWSLAGQMEQLRTHNQRLSNSVAEANAQSLSPDQLQELLRLRSEKSRLREQTAAMQKLHDENQRLQSQSASPEQPHVPRSEEELNDDLAAETVQAMKNIFAELPAALQKFAQEHNGEGLQSFSQLRKYFPMSDGKRMPGLYMFDFIRDGGPKPGDVLILGELGARRRPDKTWSRVYAFSDGRVIERTSNDDDFEAWEKQQLVLPPPNH